MKKSTIILTAAFSVAILAGILIILVNMSAMRSAIPSNEEVQANDGINVKNDALPKQDTLTDNAAPAIKEQEPFIATDGITNKMLYESIGSAMTWYKNDIHSEGFLADGYYAIADAYDDPTNMTTVYVYDLGAMWASLEMRKFLGREDLTPMVKNRYNTYLTVGKKESIATIDGKQEPIALFLLNDDSSIAYSALSMQILMNYDDLQNRDALLKRFANSILSAQQLDGSYKTWFYSDKTEAAEESSGEAVYALMKAYKFTKDERYLKSVQKAFPYYKNYWQTHKNASFVLRHTQAYVLLYEETKDPQVAELVFQMNDWLVNEHQITSTENQKLLGGMPKNNPGALTSTYVESVNSAYALAKMTGDSARQEKYKQSIKIGTRFILETQYTKETAQGAIKPDKAIGGFRMTLTNDYLRIDYTQHATAALMAAYNNRIFGD